MRSAKPVHLAELLNRKRSLARDSKGAGLQNVNKVTSAGVEMKTESVGKFLKYGSFPFFWISDGLLKVMAPP